LALQWLGQNPISPITAITKDGALRIEVTPGGIKDSFSHTNYPNKLAVLPAVRDVLERGAYLRSMDDLEGKPIKNYYFAAPVEIDGARKVVFVRAREVENNPTSLYVHEVFTEDEIEKSDELNALLSQGIPRPMQYSGTVSKKAGSASDLYRSIIRNALAVNTGSKLVDPETGEPLTLWHQTGADIEAFDPRKPGAGEFHKVGVAHFVKLSRGLTAKFCAVRSFPKNGERGSLKTQAGSPQN